MGHIHPTEKQITTLMETDESGGVVMTNLIKLKRDSTGSTQQSADAYNNYMLSTSPFLEEVGGRLLYLGEQQQVFIGGPGDEWDLVLVVEYPSRQAFLTMISNPEYIKIHSLREDALETSALLVTKPVFPA